MTGSRRMKLAAIVHPGSYSWVADEAWPAGDVSFEMYRTVAQTLERGCFDIFFLGDTLSVGRGIDLEAASRTANTVGFEPFSLLSALAIVTSRIGLIGTISTSYNHPYHVARKLASLDFLSGGRAGWNLVTSTLASEAANFGLEHSLSATERYARAEEFLTATLALWNSWTDDAFIRDKASGRYFRPDGLRFTGHRGQHFTIAGPLNIPRSPQGNPVISQAGTSEAGLELAARGADVMYASAASLPVAQAFYTDVKRRLPRHGRAPEALSILPGLLAVAGRTRAEAEDKFDRVQRRLDFRSGRALLGGYFLPGIDLSRFGPDDILPDTPEIRASAASRGFDLAAAGPNPTLRRLADWASSCYCHLLLVGSPSDIADVMEEWFTGFGADGFNLWSHHLPGTYVDFVDLVVPELQRRGLVRRRYEGTTLRDHLGLPRPA